MERPSAAVEGRTLEEVEVLARSGVWPERASAVSLPRPPAGGNQECPEDAERVARHASARTLPELKEGLKLLGARGSANRVEGLVRRQTDQSHDLPEVQMCAPRVPRPECPFAG